MKTTTQKDPADHPILREAMKRILIPEVYEYFIAMLDCDRTDDNATP